MEPRLILEAVVSRRLSREEAASLADAMLEGGLDDVVKAAILAAMRARGESPEEVAGFAGALRARAVRVEYSGDLLDTAGTGGDGYNTLNASTAASIVAAALGVRVAKHGNRSVSSRSGSADFMESIGYPIDRGPEFARCMLGEAGFAFLYAPLYHPAMRSVMGVRRRLGIRTIFNLVGPLANPAGASLQLLGVSSMGLVGVMSRAASMLGYERVIVAHGHPGIDEVSVSGETLIVEVRRGSVGDPLRLSPGDLGLETCRVEDLRVSGPGESAERVMRVFRGAGRPCDKSFIAANSGLALYVAGRASDPRDGVEAALQAIDDGVVAGFMERLRGAVESCSSRSAV